MLPLHFLEQRILESTKEAGEWFASITFPFVCLASLAHAHCLQCGRPAGLQLPPALVTSVSQLSPPAPRQHTAAPHQTLLSPGVAFHCHQHGERTDVRTCHEALHIKSSPLPPTVPCSLKHRIPVSDIKANEAFDVLDILEIWELRELRY